MRNRILKICLVACMLVGCSSGNTNESEPLKEGEYAAILPYEISTTRVKHVGLFSDLNFRLEIESGLMDLSKQYFSPSEVGYKTHQYLTFDELDATDGSRGLLGTLRDDNPNGLNPSTDEEFETGNGTATGPVLLMDAYELDFYKNDKLKGISISLVMNGYTTVNDETVDIENKYLKNYVEVTDNKLVNYMRDRFNDITSKIPIYIAVFKVNSEGIGAYAYETYYEGNSGTCKEIDGEWIEFPTSTAQEYDIDTYDIFLSYRDKVGSVLPDTSYVTAEALYEDKKLSDMTIEITATGKTAGELLAVSQAAKEYLDLFESTDAHYLVRIESNGTTYTMIEREKGSTDVNVISDL